MRIICGLLLVLSCGVCAAQSWSRADRVGQGKVKHWDDIPTQTSTSAEILNSISKPDDTPVAPPRTSSGSSAPFYDRRVLPESSALKSYFEQVLALSDEKVIKSAGLRLQLPDSVKWFTELYGTEAAVNLEKEYSALRAGWVKQFSTLLKGLRERKQNAVAVQVIQGPDDPDATPALRQAFAAMQHPSPLYTVRFINSATGEQYVMHSFAYVDGAFRYVGKLSALSAPPARMDEQPPAQ
ncbi:MAG: hypothetical protein ACR2IE_03075 [Candidatus Sumerlaeaceae bacterium]